MTAELQVGTLRLRGRPDRARQVDARAALESLDLAPRWGDRSVLVVRRLRARLSDPAGARERLADLRRTAQRPALGDVDPLAEAVEFRDEAEVLLCLSDDVMSGRAAGRWWWAGRLPQHCATPAELLTALWLAQPRWVPTVLATLHRAAPSRVEAVQGTFSPIATLALLDAVIEEHLPEVAGRVRESTAQAATNAIVPPSKAMRSFVPGGGRPVDVLLWTAITLAEHPATARTPEFLTWLTASRAGAVEPDPPSAVVAAVTLPLQPEALADEPAPPSDDGLAGSGPSARPDPEQSPPARAQAPGRIMPLRLRPRPEPPTGGAREPQPAWQHRPWAGSGPAMPTELATLLYAINLVTWFDLGRLSDRTTGWAVVEAVGRWLLRDVPTGRRRTLLADPLLTLLAELDTRPPTVRNPVRLGSAMRPVRRFLTAHDIQVSTFTQPGDVVVSRTHVDVVLGLDQIDLRARTSGLDQDPGWVPQLGRVVLFHFEGAT